MGLLDKKGYTHVATQRLVSIASLIFLISGCIGVVLSDNKAMLALGQYINVCHCT
jgi:hypothetical protein